MMGKSLVSRIAPSESGIAGSTAFAKLTSGGRSSRCARSGGNAIESTFNR
jgi:hypothetical protein